MPKAQSVAEPAIIRERHRNNPLLLTIFLIQLPERPNITRETNSSPEKPLIFHASVI
jgi:hypothetical protein